MTDDIGFLEQTIEDSFQKRSTGEEDYLSGMSAPMLARMKLANDLIAPWWSYARDRQLKAFWMGNDFLAGPMYNMVAKMQAIPFQVIPDDYSDPEKVEISKTYTKHLLDAPEYGSGWEPWFGMWVQDLLGYDNGAFAEITGAGDPIGPIRGMPGTVQILDSSQAQRTSNPMYPVIYHDTDGKRYRLHYTRVMLDSQLPSTSVWMNKVGLCAISRAINTATNLLDISIYKQEKLGSRPNRAIGITQGGLDPADVANGLEMGNIAMTTKGLRRYSQMVVLGAATFPDADLLIKDIASLPDGFDERDSVIIGMAIIALAFGVDARELFPAMQSGATRADALLSHIKQRGKGPGQILQSVERLFSRKFLPPFLQLVFNYQDDVQDRQEAEIEKIRAERRQHDLGTGVSDMRTEREKMLLYGEIDAAQFARLELESGRLQDGTSVLSLFFSDREMISNMLKNPFENILDIENNDPMEIFGYINERRAEISKMMSKSRSASKLESARQAVAALKALADEYLIAPTVEDRPEEAENRMFPIRTGSPAIVNQTEELGGNEKLETDQDDNPIVKEGGSESIDPFEIKGMTFKTMSEYRTALTGLVRGLWNGAIDIFDFSDLFSSAVRRGLRQGFIEGAKESGIEPSEFTEEENNAIDNMIASEIQYIDPFGDAIEAGSKANDGKFGDFEPRINLWVNRYGEAKVLGQVMAGTDKKYKWVQHSKEPCGSCPKLAGKVKRASEWKRNDIYPRHHTKLECMIDAKGVPVCLCELEETEDRCTPGPLPSLP